MKIIEKFSIFSFLFFLVLATLPAKAADFDADDEHSFEQLLCNFCQDAADCGIAQQIINWKTETNSISNQNKMKPIGHTQQIVQENNEVAQQLDSEVAAYLIADYQPEDCEVAQLTHRETDKVAHQINESNNEIAQQTDWETDEVAQPTDSVTTEVAQQLHRGADEIAQQLTDRGSDEVAQRMDIKRDEVSQQIEKGTDEVAQQPNSEMDDVSQQTDRGKEEVAQQKENETSEVAQQQTEVEVVQQKDMEIDEVAQQTAKGIEDVARQTEIESNEVAETSGVARQDPVEIMEQYLQIKTEHPEWRDNKIAQMLGVKNSTLSYWKNNKKYSNSPGKPRKHRKELQKLKLLDRYEKLCKEFPAITHQEASRRLKISPTTLRGWQKRYGSTEEGN